MAARDMVRSAAAKYRNKTKNKAAKYLFETLNKLNDFIHVRRLTVIEKNVIFSICCSLSLPKSFVYNLS